MVDTTINKSGVCLLVLAVRTNVSHVSDGAPVLLCTFCYYSLLSGCCNCTSMTSRGLSSRLRTLPAPKAAPW
ncbi:hypothetical protein DPMN_067533 [Dreissena polymorpha]|uniref:Uncharacterized protein n=1 Tax=Dreissena polymorpha TaxID=45954 RepID=A0A9D4BTJ3_DREPO|nr:hypothetical protein DPMN_067533 [Dreissena polymorpha]